MKIKLKPIELEVHQTAAGGWWITRPKGKAIYIPSAWAEEVLDVSMLTEKPRPYRPANGDEGEWFMTKYCYRCEHYDERVGCPIVTNTMLLDVHDGKYPREWVYREDGPVCTAFVPKGETEG